HISVQDSAHGYYPGL
nr:immunoglobulin heavy chain junction region [Mus musculus]